MRRSGRRFADGQKGAPMTPEQIERLEALLNAAEKGAIRDGELDELVKLARLVVDRVKRLHAYLDMP